MIVCHAGLDLHRRRPFRRGHGSCIPQSGMGSLVQWPFDHHALQESCRAPTLLVAEDDRPLRSALMSLFAQRGLSAFVATDGTAVIRHLVRCYEEELPGSIDVVIADVDTPGR